MLKGLSESAIDLNFAIESLKEEIVAVNDYNQRAEIVSDPELKEILMHHRNEEMEHTAMLIEWIRRNNGTFGKEIQEYLFIKEGIVSKEEENIHEEKISSISLNIGSLK